MSNEFEQFKTGDLVGLAFGAGEVGTWIWAWSSPIIGSAGENKVTGIIHDSDICLLICKKGDWACVLTSRGVIGHVMTRYTKHV